MFKKELKEKEGILSLNEINNNDFAIIVRIPTGVLHSQLIRFGISEGQVVQCLSKLPGGTLVLKLNNQEIALGSSLAKKIMIEKLLN
jgi:Fe2+ transport system protein FeoA